jgi:hypothetical protein
MARPQPKSQPEQDAAPPGLKVVENASVDRKPADAPKPSAEQQAAAARRRMHPPRVWPD